MYIPNKIVHELMKKSEGNGRISDAFAKAFNVLSRYDSVICSVSGGKDSDIMLDILSRLDVDKKIDYVWFNTGLEYQATKDHLDYLEDRYGVTIKRLKPQKPIPLSVKESGVPFLSKYVSENIKRCQKNGFKWENKSFDELIKEYPNMRSSVGWWCNTHKLNSLNISYNTGLKEFLMQNPPRFPISNMCCFHAKKNVAHRVRKMYELECVGIRKSEGGVRSINYKSCFNDSGDVARFLPVFWFSNDDEKEYDKLFEIKHSDCYEVWGFGRTGCVGCPFAKDCEEQLSIASQYEPKMVKGAKNIFGKSYEYTRQFREFQANRKRLIKNQKNGVERDLFDLADLD